MLVAVVGVALLVFGITSVDRTVTFLVFWCLVVVGIVGWTSGRPSPGGGSLYHADSSGDQPHAAPGRRAERARDS